MAPTTENVNSQMTPVAIVCLFALWLQKQRAQKVKQEELSVDELLNLDEDDIK